MMLSLSPLKKSCAHSVVFCFNAGWYIVKLWHLHRFRFEPTLITIGCSVEECAIDPAMDPMGRRQHSPSWAWDWCFCCRSSSWQVPSWLLIVHRVQWLMPQVKANSLALSKAWFSILAFSCAKLSLGLRVDALVHSFLRAYWNEAVGLKTTWRSASFKIYNDLIYPPEN